MQIMTRGFCRKCKQDVDTVRILEAPRRLHRTLTVLSLGFWPLYLSRVRWRCGQCGANTDNEKPHLVGRQMGGLRPIDKIYTKAFCDTCKNEVTFYKKFPTAGTLHERLSFWTAGIWYYAWIQTGWRCSECGNDADLEDSPEYKEILTSTGFCNECQQERLLQRKVPLITWQHRVLSFTSAGGWMYTWIRFGWKCTHCGHGGEDGDAVKPGETIEIRDFCPNCNDNVPLTRKFPVSNFFNRILALITFGGFSISWIRSRWRCSRCDKKIRPNLFKKIDVREKK